MDALICEMISFGFDADDLKYLERLSDPRILAALPAGRNHLMHNVKADVILYMNVWADLLESELLENINLPALLTDPVEA